ncbi:MAG: TIGR00289 family protein [Candidatus Bathyarchaeota archaeon]|nr:TIGR00289 family protein [Candidatus Bathyarchaeota archaeon]
MRVAALVSGGKDSALALHRAIESGHSVKFLISMIPKREDSWMFHYPNINLTDLFAEAAAIPLIKGETSGVKEEELEDLKSVLETLKMEGLVSGVISSKYQKKRIEGVCRDLGLTSIIPLWKQKPLKLLNQFVELDFRAIITRVCAYGFSEDWLGRSITQKTISALIDLNRRFQVSIVGEGGEYETLVLDAPFFNRQIDLVQTRKTWEDHSGCLHVEKAKLIAKCSRRGMKKRD